MAVGPMRLSRWLTKHFIRPSEVAATGVTPPHRLCNVKALIATIQLPGRYVAAKISYRTDDGEPILCNNPGRPCPRVCA